MFRHERLDEPVELYSRHFDEFEVIFDRLIDQFPELRAESFDVSAFAALVAGDATRRALCYLTAPPISDDDLKTLAEASSFTAARLIADPASAARIRDLVFRILDLKRFPWVGEGRAPTEIERKAAVIASAALVAARKVETFRRGDAKERQESHVKDLLRRLDFVEVPRRSVLSAAHAPRAGEFMGETPVTGAKADVVAGLHDGRTLIIECKVSNSSVNSYKRIVHDTGGKATIWYQQFGRANMVVGAVLAGVFNPNNLEHVQNDKEVFLFWEHRYADLENFVRNAN